MVPPLKRKGQTLTITSQQQFVKFAKKKKIHEVVKVYQRHNLIPLANDTPKAFIANKEIHEEEHNVWFMDSSVIDHVKVIFVKLSNLINYNNNDRKQAIYSHQPKW